MKARRVFAVILALCLCWLTVSRGFAYSILTHENLIDVTWYGSIRPLLLARFPSATNAELERARGYAYGGATIQDMGYYPFGHEFFSDLTHYARTGDFVASLFANARTLDEYAFAIGALSHYWSDNIGHQDAVNPATAVEFPALAKKYGPVVTYDESPHGHVRTEFAFDVNQLNHGRFAPPMYLRPTGIGVSRRLLKIAFLDVYGLPLHKVLGHEVPAIDSYKSSVRHLLPRVAAAETLIYRKTFPADVPGPAFEQFVKRQARAESESGWNRYRRKPGFQTHLLAWVIRIVPKIGAASDLALRGPSEETEVWYLRSFGRTTDSFEGYLRQMRQDPAKPAVLTNLDLDTGYETRPGSYRLTDKTYADLLRRITSPPNGTVPESLRQNILHYYSDPNAPISTKKNRKAWKRVLADLATLQRMPARP